MSVNHVICCDGTNNQFGPQNTNVVRLAQSLDRDPSRQRLYYDPGVGTLPEPGAFTALAKWVSKAFGLAFGAGLGWKVQEAYTYLMDSWEPGDRVFLLGFSRGAYTVRVLAGLLHALGLLPRGNPNLVPYVWRLYKAVRSNRPADDAGDGRTGYWDLCDEFRRTFAREVPGGPGDRRFPVHFLGVWDTVSSVGWVWDPDQFPFTARNPGIGIIRHAVSIDERRAFYRQNLMSPMNGQDFREFWFPGVHSDVGGGYPESDGGLWREPFHWILSEAQAAVLGVNPSRLQAVLARTTPSCSPWDDPKHESLHGAWWLAEFFPKLRWSRKWNMRLPHLGLGKHRSIHRGACIHESTLRRIRESAYAPPNLSPAFRQMVQGLKTVPAAIPYDPDGKIPPDPSPCTSPLKP